MSDEQQQANSENDEQPAQTTDEAVEQAPAPAGGQLQGAEKKILAGILGILLGGFGIHKFILGYTQEGIIMLLITVLTCGWGGIVVGIIGLVEGIIYLTKTDEEFVHTYITNKKTWF